MAALSLPIGIHTYLMRRALGTLSKVHGGLAAGFCSMVDCCAMTSVVIMHKKLSSTFLAMVTMVFWEAVSKLCSDTSLYSIACPVPLPVSLLVRMVISEVS